MDTMYSVFDSLQSNADETLIGKVIKKAITPLENGDENWELILAVCDLVNSSDQGPRDAIRCLRRRLQHHEHDWKSLAMSFSVLEAMVKNCGRRFHYELANRAFLHSLRSLLISTCCNELLDEGDEMPLLLSNQSTSLQQAQDYQIHTDSIQTNANEKFSSSAILRPLDDEAQDDSLLVDNAFMPYSLQQRILGNIRCWDHVFKSDAKLKAVKDLYNELLSKGFRFPELNSSLTLVPVEASPQSLDVAAILDNIDVPTDSVQKSSLIQTIKTRASNIIKKSTWSSRPPDATQQNVNSQQEYEASTFPNHGGSLVHCSTFLRRAEIAKLKSEISVVCEHVSILNQMVSSFSIPPGVVKSIEPAQPTGQFEQTHEPSDAIDSGDCSRAPASWDISSAAARPNDIVLMNELYNTCVEMHSRILDIIGFVDEELLAQVLSLVDEINDVFSCYLEFKRTREPYSESESDKAAITNEQRSISVSEHNTENLINIEDSST